MIIALHVLESVIVKYMYVASRAHFLFVQVYTGTVCIATHNAITTFPITLACGLDLPLLCL